MQKCPRCHKMNNDNANFCKYCGAKLSINSKPRKKLNDSHVNNSMHMHSNPHQVHTAQHSSHMQPDYNQAWNNANQAMNKMSNYSNNYLIWLKDCLLHPTQEHRGHPYFGFLTFGIQALLLFITILTSYSMSSDNVLVSTFMDHALGYLPIHAYFVDSGNGGAVSAFFGAILFFVIYVLIGFLSRMIMDKHHHANLFKTSNSLARLTSGNLVVLLLLLIFCVLAENAFVQELFLVFTVIAYGGIFLYNYRASKVDSLYVGTCSIFVIKFLQGIVMTILDILI